MSAEKILVIDDEPSVVGFCQRTLERQGFEVKGALSGEEGLQLLQEEGFHLLLLDIRLPGLGGLDVLSAIQAMGTEIAVVIITGHGTMEVAIRALKLGAQDFLLKPFAPEDLVASVQKVLEKERLAQENLRLKARLPVLEISKALMAEVNLERLAQLALEKVQQTLEAERVSLMLLDEEGQELSISAALGLPDEVVDTTRAKAGQGLAGLAMQRKSPILLPEQAEDDPAIQALLTRSEIGPAICLPLLTKDRVLGVLNASRPLSGIPFRQDDVDLLSILGGQVAVAIENARLFEQAQREIAERRRAEEALREGENRFRSVVAQAYDGISLVDEQGRIIDWNQALEKITGLKAQDVLDKPIWDVQFQMTPEEQRTPEMYEQLKTGLLEFLGTGQAPWMDRVLEREYTHRDGSRSVVQGVVSAIETDRGFLLVSTSRDITERKQAEEALRESEGRYRSLIDDVIDTSTVGIFILDKSFQVVWVNQTLERFFGLRRDKVIGRDKRQLIRERIKYTFEDPEAFAETVLATYDNNTYVENFECHVLPHGEREERWLEHWSRPIRAGLYVGGRVEFYYDITERKRAEEELRQHAEQLEALRRIGLELASQLDVDVLLSSIASQAIELLGGSSGGLYLYRPEQEVLEWAVSIGPNLAPIGSVLRRGEGLGGKVWETGDTLIVDAYQQWEGRPAVYEGYPWTAVVGVPVHWGEVFLGVLEVLADAPRTFSPQDAELLGLFATQAAIALENARLYEQQGQRLSQMIALGQTTLDITSQLDMSPLLHSIIERAARLLNATGGVIHLYDPVEVRLEMVASQGLAVDYTGTRLMLGEGVAGKVVESGEPLVVNDYQNWTGKALQLTDLPTHAIIGVPMKWQNQVIGVLDIIDQSGHKVFDEDDVWVLSQFADQAAIAIENARLYKSLNQQGERLRALTARLAEAEEAERQGLARELHDQVGQGLTALGINLNIVRSQMPEEMAGLVRSRLDDSLDLVEQTTERIRDVMAELRPPVLDDYGLVAALHWYGEQFTSRTGVAITVEGEELTPRLAASVENALFRITQEALTNVAKHAQATQVTVAAEEDGGTVRLVIADNGIGFDSVRLTEPDGRQGWGLLTMAERAEAVDGQLRIESCLGEGTQVIVEVAR